MYGLSLDWELCPDGVELRRRPNDEEWEDLRKEAREHPAMGDGLGVDANYSPDLLMELMDIVKGRATPQPRFQYRTDNRVSVRYDITKLEDLIIVRFVNARTQDEIIRFFSRFGMISSGTSVIFGGITPDEVVSVQTHMRKLLETSGSGANQMEAVMAVNRWLSMQIPYGSMQSLLALDFSVSPIVDFATEENRPRLAWRASSLAAFMVLEAALIVVHDARVSSCQNCGRYFVTGPLTGRRSHAKFCSDRCRVAAMRARKAKEVAEGEKLNG